MLKEKLKNNCALVLGGYINGFSIIKELHEEGIKDIALFDSGRSIAGFSNKIIYHSIIDQKSETLLREIKKLNQKYDYIVPFPTDDQHLELLYEISDEIKDFCFIPFNKNNLLFSLDKFSQYQTCARVGIPFPKTINLKLIKDIDSIKNLNFPVLIKPTSRKDLTTNVFRTLYIGSEKDLLDLKLTLIKKLELGIEFLASEIIPGNDTNIYAYTCFRSKEGEILNEWIGKKLTQHPDNYGVFSSASNQGPPDILIQGRKLVDAIDGYGIIQPEFKFDYRDNKFKLMEINLRSMMWHRTGNLSGVKLQATQYKYATNNSVIRYVQDQSQHIHYVFMMHEISNLIARKGYWRHFKYNIWGSKKRFWAVYERADIKPFLYSLILLLKSGVSSWLRRIGLR